MKKFLKDQEVMSIKDFMAGNYHYAIPNKYFYPGMLTFVLGSATFLKKEATVAFALSAIL